MPCVARIRESSGGSYGMAVIASEGAPHKEKATVMEQTMEETGLKTDNLNTRV